MKNEFENIDHRKTNNLLFLLVDITYRRPHLHFDTEIALVLSGEGEFHVQGKTYPLHAGQAIVINSCEIHEISSSSNMRLLIMQYSANVFTSLYPKLDKILFTNQPINCLEHPTLLKNLLHCAQSYYADAQSVELQTSGYALLTLYELLSDLNSEVLSSSQQDKRNDLQERIERISSYIHDHYLENVSLTVLAEQENFSRTYFSHFFKNNFGVTFQEYVDNLRCEYGRHLLLTTKENLLNITYQSGFSDIRIFNNAYKRYYGITPREFRENFKKSGEPIAEKRPTVLSADNSDTQHFFSAHESRATVQKAITEWL
ncbi:MAG: AraC family transcriptional regulator [Streptococcaceae bacterium]|jgi:AraC-like DNA-binding protein|nr:AraC family transcriptional regulator [Streptococcaceae bacterium]